MASEKKLIKLKSNSGLSHAVDGAIGGLTAGIIVQPLQVIKTAFQIRPHSHTQSQPTTTAPGSGRSFFQLARLIYAEEGIKGFYRGFVPGCIKSSVAAAIYFYLLNASRKFYSGIVSHKSLSDFLSAMTARATQTLITNPIIIVKTRFEVIGFNEYKNMLDAFAQIYRNEGLASFFTNGIGVALLKDVPFSAIQFPIYEQTKIFFLAALQRAGFNIESKKVKVLNFAFSSLCATFISCVVTNPLDVIRTRVLFQYYNKNVQQHYRGITDAFVKMVKNDGMKGLFFGLETRFIKKIVGAIVLWTVYEYLVDSGKPRRKVDA